MISILISLLVVCIVFGILIYVVRDVMPLAQPMKNFALIIICLIFILVLLGFVTGYFPPLAVGDWRR